MATKDNRSYVAGTFALELNNEVGGWLQSVEGGYAESEVRTDKIGSDRLAKKSIANVKYSEITATWNASMQKVFWDWVKASIDQNYARQNGAIISNNFNGHEVSRLNFFNALVSELGFPALDAASKDSAKATLKFRPEYTRAQAKPADARAKGVIKRQANLWSPANFKVEAEGLSKALSRAIKVEALSLKFKIADNPVGNMRDYEIEPAAIEIPNLVITVPESHGDEFYAWHESFVIKGNCGEDQEKNFTITYLDQTRQKSLFEIQMHRCGIFKLTPGKLEAGGEKVRDLKIEMYAEDMVPKQIETAW